MKHDQAILRPKGKRTGKVRYAVAGLGWISQSAILPAFAHARKNSELAALISDDRKKLDKLGKKYRVDVRCSYDEFEQCLQAEDIDAVFIALPNHLHREYTERAAAVGVHVLCEKPLATSVSDCEAMLAATRAAGVRLMTAYRLHFEPGNRDAERIAGSGRLGELRYFASQFSMQVEDEDNIRLDRERGGGTLWDIGIYCINAARGLFQAEPEEVLAWAASKDDARFREVEEMSSVLLRFPGERLASFTCSFGAATVSTYRVIGTEGDLSLDPAYAIGKDIVRTSTVKGRTSTKTFPARDQFAPEITYFSDCVRSGEEPAPSGEEGLADVRVIEALYESIAEGRAVRLEPRPFPRREGQPEPQKPPVRERKMVHASDPSPE
jgi:glucose-fructose oxidoreductase